MLLLEQHDERFGRGFLRALQVERRFQEKRLLMQYTAVGFPRVAPQVIGKTGVVFMFTRNVIERGAELCGG